MYVVRHIIYEPFSVSVTVAKHTVGSIIATGLCRRRCYAVELNPEYVDMAVRRWQEFANQQAILDGDGRTFAEIAELRSEAVE